MCNEAYITASSRNERQFIQRRGRVLRVSPGKDKAIIHDFVITPNSTNGPFKKLAENELKRVVEFTRPSINAQDLKGQIESIIVKYGIDDDFMEKQYAD
jgi:superfamily II DNA or RNA helicase